MPPTKSMRCERRRSLIPSRGAKHPVAKNCCVQNTDRVTFIVGPLPGHELVPLAFQVHAEFMDTPWPVRFGGRWAQRQSSVPACPGTPGGHAVQVAHHAVVIKIVSWSSGKCAAMKKL